MLIWAPLYWEPANIQFSKFDKMALIIMERSEGMIIVLGQILSSGILKQTKKPSWLHSKENWFRIIVLLISSFEG